MRHVLGPSALRQGHEARMGVECVIRGGDRGYAAWHTRVKRTELRDCTLSCAVAYPTASLRDYDGGTRRGNGGFSVDFAQSLELHGEGVDCVPCACRGALSCPRARWFRISPAAL